MAGRLIVNTIEAQNFKYDSDSPAFSLDSAGEMNINHGNTFIDFSSELEFGVCNSSYNDLTGTTLTTSNATNCFGYGYRIADKLIWITLYVYKNGYTSGIGSSNTYGWAFKLPNKIVGSAGIKKLATGAYQFIPAGYIGINGTNYFNTIPVRWQANWQNMLMMYSSIWNTNWSSGSIEMHGSGILRLN